MGFENIFSIQFVSFILLEIVSHGRWKRTREKERKIYFFFRLQVSGMRPTARACKAIRSGGQDKRAKETVPIARPKLKTLRAKKN